MTLKNDLKSPVAAPPATRTAQTPVHDSVLGTLLGYRLRRAYLRVQPVAQRVLNENDLPVNGFACLSVIVDNSGIAQTTLAEALQIEASNVVVILDGLEKRGLISRAKVPTDRRRHALYASNAGRKLRDSMAVKLKEVEDAILARLEPDRQEWMMSALKQLAEPPMD